MNPDRFGWLIRRALRMSPLEIAWRIWEQIKRQMDRRRRFGWGRFAVDLGGIRPPRALDLRPRFPETPSPRLDAWMEAVRLGRLSTFSPLLGDLPPGFWRDREVWRRDALSGVAAPPDDRFALDIPYRDAAGAGWEVRRVWEINRLSWLQAHALIASLTQDSAADDEMWAALAAWMAANPPFRGLAWATGVEAASRLVSVLAALATVGAPPPGHRGRVHAFLVAHAWWIARYPSRFSSANNHRIAEQAALYLFELAKGGDERARPFGAALEREALRQIHADGVGREQAPAYTAYSLEWLSLAEAAAREAGTPFSPPVRKRLAAAREHMDWLRDKAGAMPAIGDDDHSRVLIAPPGDRPPTSSSLHDCMRTFSEGGLTVWRAVSGGPRLLLVFDHGSLGHLSIAAHGHADALAVWLHLGGEAVIADAGTGLYHSGGEARGRLRGTFAHNTLCLEGEDQSLMVGSFAWARHARSRVIDAGKDWVEAEHDGYRRRFGLIHRRRVAMQDGDVIIEDRLIGHARRPGLRWSIGYLLGMGAAVVLDHDTAVVTTTAGRRLVLTLEADGAIWRAEPAEISPVFGEMAESVRLVLRGLSPFPGQSDLVARIRIRVL